MCWLLLCVNEFFKSLSPGIFLFVHLSAVVPGSITLENKNLSSVLNRGDCDKLAHKYYGWIYNIYIHKKIGWYILYIREQIKQKQNKNKTNEGNDASLWDYNREILSNVFNEVKAFLAPLKVRRIRVSFMFVSVEIETVLVHERFNE